MKSKLALVLAVFLMLLTTLVNAQNAARPAASQPLSLTNQQLSPEEIIRRFAQKESEAREAWKEYIYRQETKFQVLGQANTVAGEFYQLSEFVFTDAGKRVERILKAPPSTLSQSGLEMTPEDRNAIVNLQPFTITTEDLPKYSIRYLGREKIDELNTWVFEITPKVLSDAREMERLKKQKIEAIYFQGRVWVDDVDFQIVKSAGKLMPEFKQRFPKFETYRENLDGKYWFPTYTYGDDVLDFEKGLSVHVRMVVRYRDYRQFQGNARITITGDELTEEDKELMKKEAGSGKPAAKEPEKKPADKKEPEKKEPEKKKPPQQ